MPPIARCSSRQADRGLERVLSSSGEDADITIEEIGPYFEDIGIVDMDSDVGVYLVSYELGSKAMGRLGEKEFVEAWGKLKCVPFFSTPSPPLSSPLVPPHASKESKKPPQNSPI